MHSYAALLGLFLDTEEEILILIYRQYNLFFRIKSTQEAEFVDTENPGQYNYYEVKTDENGIVGICLYQSADTG